MLWLGIIFIFLSWLVNIYQTVLLIDIFKYAEPFNYFSNFLAEFLIAPIFLLSGIIFICLFFIKRRSFIGKLKKILGITIVSIIILPLLVFYIFGFLRGGRNYFYAPGNRPNIDWVAGDILVRFNDDVTVSEINNLIEQTKLINPVVSADISNFDGPEWIVDGDFINPLDKSTALEQELVLGQAIAKICSDTLVAGIKENDRDDACKFIYQGRYLGGFLSPRFLVRFSGSFESSKINFFKKYSGFSELPADFSSFAQGVAGQIIVVWGHQTEIQKMKELKNNHPEIKRIILDDWIKNNPYRSIVGFFVQFDSSLTPIQAKEIILNEIGDIDDSEIELRQRSNLVLFKVPAGQEERWEHFFEQSPFVDYALLNFIPNFDI